MGDSLNAFAIGWMIADSLGWGKGNKNKKPKEPKEPEERKNKVFQVGGKQGENPKEKAISAILEQVEDGDTIVLTSDIIDSFNLKHIVTIDGQGHTFFVADETVGINLYAHCKIKNCRLVVGRKANGINIRQAKTELYLENCVLTHRDTENLAEIYPSISSKAILDQLLLDEARIDKAYLLTRKIVARNFSIGMPLGKPSTIGVYENEKWAETEIEAEQLHAVNTTLVLAGKIQTLYALESSVSTYGKSLAIGRFTMDFTLDSAQQFQKKQIYGLKIYGNTAINQVFTPETVDERFAKAAQLFYINPKDPAIQVKISGSWDLVNRYGSQVYNANVHFEDYRDKTLWAFYREEAKITFKDSSFKFKKMYTPKPKPQTAQEKLDEMIGLAEVKKKVKTYIASSVANKMRAEQGINVSYSSLHLLFCGAPGTGKTQVAHLVGEILHQNGLTKNKTVKEVTAKDLIGEYTGQTSPKTHQVVMEALGGILFIDEAYELDPSNGGSDGYKKEALATLVKDMDQYRSQLIVVMAGYTQDIEKLMEANAGLASRFINKIYFADYSAKELLAIADLQLRQQKQTVEADAKALLQSFITTSKAQQKVDGNGRWVRNFLQFIFQARDVRIVTEGLIKTDPKALNLITLVDVQEAIKDFQG